MDKSYQALINARHAAGLSQRALASRMGVHLRTVGRWEQGSARVPRAVLIVLERMKEQPCTSLHT